MSQALAVLLGAVVAALLVPDPARPLSRLAPDGPGTADRVAAPRSLPVLAACLVVLTAGTVAATGSVAVAVAAGTAVLTAASTVRTRGRRRSAEARRAQVVDLLGALAAELRAGSQARLALATVCAGSGPLRPVAAAARSPVADPATALADAAAAPGAGALADLAVAWRVVSETGAGMADVVERLAATARSDDEVRREVAAQLAGPRAAATLLSALPGAGVALGAALGADPLGFLLGAPVGRACLLAGVLLVATGTAWTEAVARRADTG